MPRERGATQLCVRYLRKNARVSFRVRITPSLIVQKPVYEMARTAMTLCRGLYYIEYIVTLEDHPALALQERTGHLGNFTTLNQAVPLGWALRCLAELDEGTTLQGVALGELHHVACTAGGGERSAVGARRLGCLTRGCELFLLRRRSALGGVGENRHGAWAGGI